MNDFSTPANDDWLSTGSKALCNDYEWTFDDLQLVKSFWKVLREFSYLLRVKRFIERSKLKTCHGCVCASCCCHPRKFTWMGKGINSTHRECFSNSWKRSVLVERSLQKKLKLKEKAKGFAGLNYTQQSESTKTWCEPQISLNLPNGSSLQRGIDTALINLDWRWVRVDNEICAAWCQKFSPPDWIVTRNSVNGLPISRNKTRHTFFKGIKFEWSAEKAVSFNSRFAHLLQSLPNRFYCRQPRISLEAFVFSLSLFINCLIRRLVKGQTRANFE